MDRSSMSEEAKASYSPEEKARFAEERVRFWRMRCLDHAHTIDIRNREISDLKGKIRSEVVAEATEVEGDGWCGWFNQICPACDFEFCAQPIKSKMTEADKLREALSGQITAYLSSGGLFNPELADHVKVRDLLIECRDALTTKQSMLPAEAKGK